MSRTATARPRVAVVGGGIAGLAAAYEAAVHGNAEVVLLEAGPGVGGKLATSPFAGVPLDTSADAFLARVPWATELCREIGLGEDLVAPAVGSAYVWQAGALRRLPEGLVLGVPTDLDALAASALISPDGLARAAADLQRPADDPVELAATAREESVGSLVRRRLGDEVFEVLVDPLLSGVNAGDADQLSVAATAPQLAAAAGQDTSLIRALRAQAAAATQAAHDEGAIGLAPTSRPAVFFTVVGGMGRIVERLVERIGAQRVRCGERVTAVEPTAGAGTPRYRLVSSATTYDVDAVVLATPAPVTAALVQPHDPQAAAVLGAIGYASVTLVSLAYRPGDVARPLDASGFLVPRHAGLFMTACSWSSSKFTHLGADGTVRLRASVGRSTDHRHDHLDDGELLAALRRDLATTMGITAEPLATRVSRWPSSLPQYQLGHLTRVAELERLVARSLPGVGLAGAAYRGLGVPACINSGRSAARAVLAAVAAPR